MSAGLEAALTTLEGLAKREEKPSHYVARHLLIELGQALDQGEAQAAIQRARAAAGPIAAAWRTAVETELSLACGEFAQSLDPRYLALPSYDLEYTRGARARLGDRLRAAEALGFALQPRETEVLALADQVFEAFLARRAGGTGPGNPSEGPGSGPREHNQTHR